MILPGNQNRCWYDDFVRDTSFAAERGDSRVALAIYALGLTGESGEVADVVKKSLDRGKMIDQQSMLLELGDVMWYLTALAHFHGFTLADVQAANIRKLQARQIARSHGHGQS